MQLLNYTIQKYNIEVDTLPADLRELVEKFYWLTEQAQSDEQKEKLTALEKVVVIRVAQYGEANKQTPKDNGASLYERFERSNEPEPISPQYEGGESVTFRLNKGEPFPKYKGKFYWVAMITGASQKYQLERQFVSERIDENNQWLASAVLNEGNFYEIKDGYDNYFVTIEKGQIVKLTKDEIVTRFNAPKREPREPRSTPSVQEPKQDIESDMPFAQYMTIIERYRELKEDIKADRRYEKDLKLESFIDSEGYIYLKKTFKSTSNHIDWHESTGWTRIGKGGKAESYYPESQSKREFYQFGEGKNKHYGLPVPKKEGWYRPCKEDGYAIDFVNGKVVDSNVKRLNDLGFQTETSHVYSSRRFVIFKDQTPPVAKRMGEPDLKPIVLPTRLRVPDAKREPHYKTIEDSTKLNSLIIKQEIILGKMEVAKYKYFDGMEDIWKYYRNDELVWQTPQVAPDASYHERLYTRGDMIDWGSYYIRYNGKKGNAYVYLDSDNQQPKSSNTKTPSAKPTPPANDTATAQKFYKTAESLRKKSKDWYDSHRNSLVNTPKRQREYNGGAIDADIMAEKAEMYEAIGKAYENGTLPDVLKDISPAMAKNDLSDFVYSFDTSGGYYSIVRTNKRIFESKPTQKQIKQWAAIEQLLKGSSKPAISDEERQKQKRLKEIENDMKFSKQENFFPTPLSIIEKMLKLADMKDGMTVLEPSAGLGHIADAVRERYPSSPIDVCEKLYTLQEYLRLKGYNVVGSDTIELTGKYDRILMNPPFTPPGIDGDHLRHCFDLLKPNGVLVAVMSAGTFFRSNKKDTAFREWFEENNGYKIDLPKDSFMGKDAFVQTGVNTVLVKLVKGGQSQTQPYQQPQQPSYSSSSSSSKAKGEAVVSDLKLALNYIKGEKRAKYQSLIDDLELALKYSK